MAKNEGLLIAGAIIVAVLLLGQQQPAQTSSSGDGSGGNTGAIDLCKLVDGQVSFTGQKMFLTGTALPAEAVRVIKQGSIMDLGITSLNSGTLAVTPNGKYKLYYGENATEGASASYYATVEEYTAPCQDAADNRVGVLCAVDTAPTITVFDENGQVQSGGGSTNIQSVGASDIIDVEVKVKAAADKCYGAPSSSKKNAICFTYNSTVFDSVKANTPSSAIPYSVSSWTLKNTGYAQSCYELNLLQDTGNQVLTVTLDASSTQPTSTNHNINISLEDVGFDLDQDSLAEIWGFDDETNNNLGANMITGGIGVN